METDYTVGGARVATADTSKAVPFLDGYSAGLLCRVLLDVDECGIAE